jgi:hypothetical protein
MILRLFLEGALLGCSPSELPMPIEIKLKLKLKLRPTVSRPRLGVRHPSGTRDQFFFLLEIFFRELRLCYFIAPSLTRRRVCNLLLLLTLATAVPLGSECRGIQDHILLSQLFRLPQPGGLGPRIYIPQEQGGTDIAPGTGFSFRRLIQLAGPSHGMIEINEEICFYIGLHLGSSWLWYTR